MGESKAREWLRQLLAAGPDAAVGAAPAAPELLAEARRQRLDGVLLAALECARPPWAEGLLPALQAHRRDRVVRSLQQVALGARVASVLERAGIRALPLKGVVLAETVYEIESQRPMADVDILALERWQEAARALLGSGFSEAARADHARVLVEERSGLVLELHRSVTSAPGLFPLDAEGVWSRRRAGRGQLAALPSVEDLLLQLALHAAFQHGFVLTLVQWLDFRRVLEREPVSTDQLLALATCARAVTALAAALLAAEAVVAAPLPPRLRPSLETLLPAGLRPWLAPRLRAPLSLVEPSPADVGRARWELLAGRRGELLWRTLVLPETAKGDPRLVPRLAQAATRLVRLGRNALPSLTGLHRGD